jgi:hypothetical protein
MQSLIVDAISKGTYWFKKECPVYTGESMSVIAVGTYYIPHYMVLSAMAVLRYDRSAWHLFKTACIFGNGMLMFALSQFIAFRQDDSLLCADAVESRLCYQASTAALIATLDMWQRTVHSYFPLIIKKITHDNFTWNNFLWSLFVNVLLVILTCWGVIYLHVFRLTETLVGVAFGFGNAILFGWFIFFFIIPNLNTRPLSYLMYLLCIELHADTQGSASIDCERDSKTRTAPTRRVP